MAGDPAAYGRVSAKPLHGREVLVTRPREQAAALVDAITAAGAVALRFPTLSIEPVTDCTALDAALRRLAGFDLVVFASANAGLQAQARCRALGLPGLALIRCAAAPGPGTAAVLAELGVASVIAPSSRFDSDGLIAAIDAAGIEPSNALILRGANGDDDDAAGSGRQQIGQWLGEGGAAVQTLASYRRAHVKVSAAELEALLARPVPDALVVSSSEGGRGLAKLLGDGGLARMAAVPAFVPHARIADCMRGLGFADVHLTAGSDAGIMNGLLAYFRQAQT